MIEIALGIILAFVLILFSDVIIVYGFWILIFIIGAIIAGAVIIFSLANHTFAIFMIVVLVVGALIYHNQDKIKEWLYL